jgi:hypothetical protein
MRIIGENLKNKSRGNFSVSFLFFPLNSARAEKYLTGGPTKRNRRSRNSLLPKVLGMRVVDSG